MLDFWRGKLRIPPLLLMHEGACHACSLQSADTCAYNAVCSVRALFSLLAPSQPGARSRLPQCMRAECVSWHAPQVTVCESHSIPGGAAHAWVQDGFHFESGPSLYSGMAGR